MTPSIFITGTGRSGSNLLKEIFRKHSEVATLPFEHRFTVDPQGLFPFYKGLDNWSPYIADYRLRTLESFLISLANKDTCTTAEGEQVPYQDWELETWIPGYSEKVETLIKQMTSYSYTASYPGSTYDGEHNTMRYYSPQTDDVAKAITFFIDECHASICQSQGKRVLVEDNTWTYLYTTELGKLVPEAKLIYIVRDPRDVVASMYHQRWTPSTLEQVTTYYSDLMRVWLDAVDSLSDSSTMVLRLEDLIDDTDAQIESLCRYANLEPESAMLEVDLSRSHRGRYQRDFNPEQVKTLNAKLGVILQAFNYQA